VRTSIGMQQAQVYSCTTRLKWVLILGFRDQAISIRRMMSSGMLRRLALVRTDVSEELNASFKLALFLVHRFLSP
jgi:hypothetical protein